VTIKTLIVLLSDSMPLLLNFSVVPASLLAM